jgi:hypothetical protein
MQSSTIRGIPSVIAITALIFLSIEFKASAASITLSRTVTGSFNPRRTVWDSGPIPVSSVPNSPGLGVFLSGGDTATINVSINGVVVLYDEGFFNSDEGVKINVSGGASQPRKDVNYTFTVGSLTGTGSTNLFGDFNVDESVDLIPRGGSITINNFSIGLTNLSSSMWYFREVSVSLSADKAVPEPVTTLLSSGLALGFGGLLKREYSKKQKKLKDKAII